MGVRVLVAFLVVGAAIVSQGVESVALEEIVEQQANEIAELKQKAAQHEQTMTRLENENVRIREENVRANRDHAPSSRTSLQGGAHRQQLIMRAAEDQIRKVVQSFSAEGGIEAHHGPDFPSGLGDEEDVASETPLLEAVQAARSQTCTGLDSLKESFLCTKEVAAAAEKDLPVPDATSTPPTPRLWIGSHSDTHGDEFPVQHGEHGKWTGPSKFNGKWLNCKTFVSWLDASCDGVSVNVTSDDGRTCTSCPANQAFIMNFHKSRAGQCNQYTTTQVQKCIKLNENNNQEAFTAKAKLCTKVRLIETVFNVHAFPQDAPERLFFSSVSGKDHRAVAKCAFRKETVCDDTGTCAEKKQIKCLEVCKMTKWQAGAKGGAWYDSCDATKCKGEHSIWPCREVGMME